MDTLVTGAQLVLVITVGQVLAGFLIGYINASIERHRHKQHQAAAAAFLGSLKENLTADPAQEVPEGAVIRFEDL